MQIASSVLSAPQCMPSAIVCAMPHVSCSCSCNGLISVHTISCSRQEVLKLLQAAVVPHASRKP